MRRVPLHMLCVVQRLCTSHPSTILHGSGRAEQPMLILPQSENLPVAHALRHTVITRAKRSCGGSQALISRGSSKWLGALRAFTMYLRSRRHTPSGKRKGYLGVNPARRAIGTLFTSDIEKHSTSASIIVGFCRPGKCTTIGITLLLYASPSQRGFPLSTCCKSPAATSKSCGTW